MVGTSDPTIKDAHEGRPPSPEEVHRELLRSLELMEREIVALGILPADVGDRGTQNSLSTLRYRLLMRLDQIAETGFDDREIENVKVIWRHYRLEFERLATRTNKRYLVRWRHHERGPRW